MNCNNCGAFNTSGSKFCGACGNEILVLRDSEVKPALVRATFVPRALAFLIDIVILLIADILFNFSMYGTPENNLITFFLLFVIYFWYFTASSGQTIGKMLLKIKVTVLSGKKAGGGVALARAFSYWISALFLFSGFLAALGKEKSAFHDRITGTIVIRS